MSGSSDFNDQLRRLRASIQDQRKGREQVLSRARSEHHVGWIGLVRDARLLSAEVADHPSFHYFRVSRDLQEFSFAWRATARHPKRLTLVYKTHPTGKQHPNDFCFWYSDNGVSLERMNSPGEVMEAMVRLCALYTAD